jgi:hypothetical protein
MRFTVSFMRGKFGELRVGFCKMYLQICFFSCLSNSVRGAYGTRAGVWGCSIFTLALAMMANTTLGLVCNMMTSFSIPFQYFLLS